MIDSSLDKINKICTCIPQYSSLSVLIVKELSTLNKAIQIFFQNEFTNDLNEYLALLVAHESRKSFMKKKFIKGNDYFKNKVEKRKLI
ncbi:hypothetical protein BpHYR1_023192 [Brachionus plicatilis]|uniref:Uncharacterized protein n=1 Tax=Brachionus plicatilis TaxID=10195 RepID=A0A3M7PUV3_BRAPC|nr:hypothetical protein BpHYR1_023192 [Brachionus plicatilis]